ncbi:hypothetical protein HDU82_000997, partial [Entophlyctis luteolus]
MTEDAFPDTEDTRVTASLDVVTAVVGTASDEMDTGAAETTEVRTVDTGAATTVVDALTGTAKEVDSADAYAMEELKMEAEPAVTELAGGATTDEATVDAGTTIDENTAAPAIADDKAAEADVAGAAVDGAELVISVDAEATADVARFKLAADFALPVPVSVAAAVPVETATFEEIAAIEVAVCDTTAAEEAAEPVADSVEPAAASPIMLVVAVTGAGSDEAGAPVAAELAAADDN